jgi:hypothetical protein
LTEAESPEKALEKTEKRAREDAEVCSDGLTLNGKPAAMVFVGIRKLIEVRTIGDIEDKPADGSEVTYSELVLDSEDDLRKLVAGESVRLCYQRMTRLISARGGSHSGARGYGRETGCDTKKMRSL